MKHVNNRIILLPKQITNEKELHNNNIHIF